jgi:hypothetical protein
MDCPDRCSQSDAGISNPGFANPSFANAHSEGVAIAIATSTHADTRQRFHLP